MKIGDRIYETRGLWSGTVAKLIDHDAGCVVEMHHPAAIVIRLDEPLDGQCWLTLPGSAEGLMEKPRFH